MGVVINVRGINASGKSTAVREWCIAHSLKPVAIRFQGQEYRVMTNGREYALGWYKPYSESEGLDSMKSDKDEFKLFLHWFLRKYRPDVVVYEKQIWATTFKLTNEISCICRKYGYKFAAVLMQIGYEDALNRLYNRNGGKDTDFNNFDGRYKAVYTSARTIAEHGIPLFYVDSMKVRAEDMKEICPQAAIMAERGERRGRIEQIIARAHG